MSELHVYLYYGNVLLSQHDILVCIALSGIEGLDKPVHLLSLSIDVDEGQEKNADLQLCWICQYGRLKRILLIIWVLKRENLS